MRRARLPSRITAFNVGYLSLGILNVLKLIFAIKYHIPAKQWGQKFPESASLVYAVRAANVCVSGAGRQVRSWLQFYLHSRPDRLFEIRTAPFLKRRSAF
jgi:hypothetical protein